MGFFPNAAKIAANSEIWAGGRAAEAYKEADALVASRAQQIGARYTIVRAGTLKGGAVGDALEGGSGCPAYLSTKLYDYGQKDIVNWRLLYDCSMLGVTCDRGDVLPGAATSSGSRAPLLLKQRDKALTLAHAQTIHYTSN